MLWKLILSAFFVAVFAIGVCAWGVTFLPSYQDCKTYGVNYDPSKDQSRANNFVRKLSAMDNTPIDCEGFAANANGSAITGVATVFLTIATVLLGCLAWDQSRAGRAELRAYVIIDVIEFGVPKIDGKPDLTSTAPWYIHIVMKNFGHTPAYDVSLKYDTEICLPKADDAVLEFTNRADTQFTAVIAPDQKITVRTNGLDDGRTTYDAHNAIGNRAYVCGRIDYSDCFGRPHFTAFQSHTFFAQVLQFGYLKNGNGTDDNAAFSRGSRISRRLCSLCGGGQPET